MRWRKLGLLYCPSGPRHPKLATHAANPLAVSLGGNVYRVFYSGRDAVNRSSVGAVDIDIVRQQVVRDHPEPFFECGLPGSFHADGVSIGNCYQAGGKTYMLFMGWQSPADGHWRGDIGRLELKPDLTLRSTGESPLMDRNDVDPISLSYPWVIDDGQGGFQMWYGSTLTWNTGNGEMLHVIHGARSSDGDHWNRSGLAVPYLLGKAQAFSRPTVARNRNGLQMWFSYRGGNGIPYRIGRAESPDGVHWCLALDDPDIDVSASGWDSEMQEYPFVFDHGSDRYMLYNGNGYGRTGFGLAILESL